VGEGGKGSRDRLIEAMIVTAARYGYGGASVARVLRQAGVSRATFYKHFANREACFAAAYRDVRDEGLQALAAAPEGSNLAILEALLGGAERNPAAARVFFIESLAAGAEIRREHEETLSAIDRALETRLDAAAAAGKRLELPARMLLGGVAGVVALRVFRGEAGRLGALSEDLLAWSASYALPGDAPRRDSAAWEQVGRGLGSSIGESLGDDLFKHRLPRGRSALPPTQAAGEQRERVLAAVALLSKEKGYAAMSVADIVATAAITRETFYEQFRGKEDAFLATQAFGLEASVSLTAGKFFSEEAWPDRVWSGLEAAFGYIAAQRTLVYVDLAESYAAGPAAIRRSLENRMAYTLFLEEGYRQRPEAKRLPRLTSEAISGAMQELFRRQVALGRSARMLELLPQAAYLTLAPFIGPGAALELIEAKMQTLSPRSPGSPGGG
jgi:AcrR family transcriptional regulator